MPPSVHEPSRAAFRFVSDNALVVVPSVGAATRPEAKPGVVTVFAVVVVPIAFAATLVPNDVGPAIHDSMPAVERAVALPPAEDA